MLHTTSVPDVETTLQNIGTKFYQRCFKVASALVKISNPVGLVMIMDL